MPVEDQFLHCPLCDQAHRVTVLTPGQRALCVRCGTTMAERGWLGRSAALAFALTGFFLFIPALILPFVTLGKIGRERTTFLTVGFEGFWSHRFESLGVWVLLCGTLAPLALLTLLIAVLWTDRRPEWRHSNALLRRCARDVGYWAMPEVQVLGVMVAFFKLGDLVDVVVGPGLWCYGIASLFTLLAWRRFNFQPQQERTPVLAGVIA